MRPALLADRMVADYCDDLYRPAAAASRQLAERDYAQARELTAWVAGVRAAWPEVRVRPHEVDAEPARGDQITLSADVELGPLSADDVEVQAFYGRLEGHTLHDATPRPMAASSTPGRYEAAVELGRGGSYGYTVRVVPAHALLRPGELGLVRTPEDGA